MIRIVLSFIASFIFSAIGAQKENSIWLFPDSTVVDFSNNTPSIRKKKNNFYTYMEGHAVVCDKEGGLLFYTDGGKVYNRKHEIMSNSVDIPLEEYSSSAQQCAIIKSTRDTNIYIMLSLNHYTSKGELYQSRINMSLNNGFGDIEKGSIVKLGENFTEQLFVVAHPCSGYWVVTHERDNNVFRSLHFEDMKLVKQINSNIGVAFQGYSFKDNVIGSIYISKKNDLVYLDTRGTFEKFKFNPYTGVIADPKLIFEYKENIGFYKGQFSPDQDLFYTYCLTRDSGFIGQFDFRTDSIQRIKSSLVKIDVQNSIAGVSSSLGLGTENKLYFVSSLEKFSLGVFNEPNIPGIASNFDSVGLKIPNRFTSKAFPTPLIFETANISDFLPADTVSCSALNISAHANILYDSIKWSTGASTSDIQLQKSGNYQAELFKNGCVYYDSIQVDINYFQEERTELICENDVYNYKGIDYLVGEVIRDSITSPNDICDTVLSITISSRDLIHTEQTIAICEGDSYFAEDGNSYTQGDTVKLIRIGKAGQCDSLINQIIKNIPIPVPTITGQKIICFGAKADLTASLHKSYLWNTGAVSSSIKVGNGNYEVIVVDTLNCTGKAKITIIERPEWLLDILDTLQVVSGQSYDLQLIGDKSRISSVEIIPTENMINYVNDNLDINIRGESALYKLIFRDDIGCLIEQELYIEVSKEEQIFAPNILRLNANQHQNRQWAMQLGANLTFEEAAIYDRWGNQVFYTTEVKDTWNGSFGGKAVGSGVYIYVIKAKDFSGKTMIKRGDVVVVD